MQNDLKLPVDVTKKLEELLTEAMSNGLDARIEQIVCKVLTARDNDMTESIDGQLAQYLSKQRQRAFEAQRKGRIFDSLSGGE